MALGGLLWIGVEGENIETPRFSKRGSVNAFEDDVDVEEMLVDGDGDSALIPNADSFIN